MSLIQINLKEMKVLVVDDSATARKILTEMLHEIGVGHFDVAADGAEAIERLRVFPADIMLCDLHMAPLDGIELTRLIRNASDSPNPYIPIIVLTADATELQLKAAVNAGVNSFMSKPINRNVLHRKLFAIFSHPQTYIRQGSALLPLLNCKPAKPEQSAEETQDKAPTSVPRPKDDDRDDRGDVEQRPLTRRDLGFT